MGKFYSITTLSDTEKFIIISRRNLCSNINYSLMIYEVFSTDLKQYSNNLSAITYFENRVIQGRGTLVRY